MARGATKKRKAPARKRKIRTGGMRRHIGKDEGKDLPVSADEDAGC